MPRGGRRGNNFTKKIRAPRTFAFDIPSIQPEVYKAIEQTLEFNEQQQQQRRRRKEEEEQKNRAHLAKKRKLEDASVRDLGEEEVEEMNESDGVNDNSLSKNDETSGKSDDAVEVEEAGAVGNKNEGNETGEDKLMTEKDDRIGSEEADKIKEDDKAGEELNVKLDKLTSAHLEELNKEKSELEAKCQEDENESTKLKSEVDKLNNTKSQMVWLMKQVWLFVSVRYVLYLLTFVFFLYVGNNSGSKEKSQRRNQT